MEIRFYIDSGTGQPHIYGHDVDEAEVADVLENPGEDRPGRQGSRAVIGQTSAGRYRRVIYVRDPEPDKRVCGHCLRSGHQAIDSLSPQAAKKGPMKANRFPPGWNEGRVQNLIAHYESQNDAEAIAEDEAALEDPTQAVMLVPRTLVPAVRKLLAKHDASTPKRRATGARGFQSKRRAA
jgi:hypothetical protein